MKYLPCLSRKCACGYFKGKWKNESCIIRKGIKLQRAYRQEIRTLSDEKRKRWEVFSITKLNPTNRCNPRKCWTNWKRVACFLDWQETTSILESTQGLASCFGIESFSRGMNWIENLRKRSSISELNWSIVNIWVSRTSTWGSPIGIRLSIGLCPPRNTRSSSRNSWLARSTRTGSSRMGLIIIGPLLRYCLVKPCLLFMECL